MRRLNNFASHARGFHDRCLTERQIQLLSARLDSDRLSLLDAVFTKLQPAEDLTSPVVPILERIVKAKAAGTV